jgi:hypothetical protein
VDRAHGRDQAGCGFMARRAYRPPAAAALTAHKADRPALRLRPAAFAQGLAATAYGRRSGRRRRSPEDG